MDYINQLIVRYPNLSLCKNSIQSAVNALINCYKNGGKLLVCGNGGSCADAEHITGELMKGFLKKRPLSEEKINDIISAFPQLDKEKVSSLQYGLATIPLNSSPALNFAFANDCCPDMIFAQQVLGYGKNSDIFLGISTSGNAENVCAAAAVARYLGLTVVSLTGHDGGKLSKLSDISIVVNETETYKIQELHLPVYHAICAEVEEYFFDK